jgi:circadian clock protein KaiC
MVVDGFRTARQVRETELGLSEFIHQLNGFITGARCTTVLLAPFSGSEPHPEHTLVDGLIELNHAPSGMRRTREIEVYKLRAANHLLGRHTFEITGHGIVIFPRLEALALEAPIPPLDTRARLSFGIPSFDRIIDGGLVAASATTILGPPGAGKTLLGLKFLDAGIRNHERCLYFGFYEPTRRLVGKAQQLGIALAPALKSGAPQIIWQAPLERSLDELGNRLLETVRTHQIKRVFIDGIEGFRSTDIHPERFTFFMAALIGQLRTIGITTVISEESDLSGAQIRHALGLSAFIENMIVLRYGELRSKLYRLISIIKLRESSYDSAIHEFSISPHGLAVTASFKSAENILADQSELPVAGSKFHTKTPGKASATRRARGSRK